MILSPSLNQQNTANKKVAFFLLAWIPFIVWLISVGDLPAYFSLKVPPGQILYLFSKLAGLYAYFFMVIQLIIGLQGRQSRYFRYHPLIGGLTTLTIIAHFSFFVAGASLRTNHFAVQFLWPSFSSGYYKSAISYGVIAAYLLLPIIIAGALQRKLPSLKWLHRFAPIVVLLGCIHSFSIGTEIRSLPTMVFYISFFCLALFAFIKKLSQTKT